MINNKLLYIILILVCFLCNSFYCNSNLLQNKNNDISIIGNPDSLLLDKYYNQQSSFKYIFNSMMTLDVIVEDTGAYHCFIMENIDNIKQLSYFTLDDVLKYNYIPYYDSLEYDLSLTFEQTEYEHKNWSTKFKNIPYLRKKSEKYNNLIGTCNDDKKLSDFCNNSIFFKSDINHEIKMQVLTKLIEITQTQLVGTFLRFNRKKKNAIVLGWISEKDSYKILKFKHLFRGPYLYYTLNDVTSTSYNFEDWLNDKNNQLKNDYQIMNIEQQILKSDNYDENIIELVKKKKYLKYSNYLLHIQRENLKFINNNFDCIKTKIDSCKIMICLDYKYSDCRIFFFDIDYNYETNKISITKDYFNKEFLPTTRITNYYLVF